MKALFSGFLSIKQTTYPQVLFTVAFFDGIEVVETPQIELDITGIATKQDYAAALTQAILDYANDPSRNYGMTLSIRSPKPVLQLLHELSMDEEYSNRELDLKFDAVHNKLDTIVQQNTSLDVKVTFTNGKVKKIVIALVLLAGIVIGMNFSNPHDIINLLANLV